ncbi:MAG: L,D-transpeptidase [Candidatus Zixiibacteriota bacterium]|jgi:hypothetical protein
MRISRIKWREAWLCLLTVAVSSLALWGCTGSAEDLPPAEEPPAEVPVKIINGAGRADVCREIAAKLGVDVGAEVESYRDANGNLDYSLRETTILCDDAHLVQANAVREVVGVGSVASVPGLAQIEMIVGWDAAGPPWEDAPGNGVLVKKAEKAVYFLQNGELAEVWPCAIGKPESPTPTGRYEVTVTLEKPTWYWQGKAIPPGPDNGLGDWFIGISKKGYGLHGTNEPPSIGTAASHGCVRMYNEHAGELVSLVSPGTVVVIAE